MNFALTRKLIVFGLVLPLAAIIGFTLATPEEFKTYALMAFVIGLLLLPILLKWYQPFLIFSWNAFVNVYFLPGRPELWMLLSAIGITIAIINAALDPEQRFINIPSLTIPILFFLSVVVLTAKFTGGMGVRALSGGQIGSGAIGGRGYFHLLFAIMGYFVITSRAIPIERVKRYLAMFFLSGATAIFSNLAYMLGPAFYFLFYLFPVELALNQALADWSVGALMVRVGGLAHAGAGIYYFMLARYGIRGILDLTKWWRLLIVLAAIFISLFSGFRSLLIAYMIMFVVQFLFEGLHRTRLFVVLMMAGILGGALMFPFISKMPAPVQRCLAFVPGLPVSPVARADAEVSTRWRTEMWSVLVPQVPKYLFFGKGYALNPADLYLASQAELRGLAKNYEVSIIAGAYHNGPLSIIIPFGIWGMLGFVWIAWAGIHVLYRNYRYGDPAIQTINTFLLAYFVMRLLIFVSVFGALESDFFRFIGILGLSVAINRGVRKPAESPELTPVRGLEPATA